MSLETNGTPWYCARNVECRVSVKLKFKDASSLFFRSSQSMQGPYIINSSNIVCHDMLQCEIQEELQETQIRAINADIESLGGGDYAGVVPFKLDDGFLVELENKGNGNAPRHKGLAWFNKWQKD